MFQRGRRPSFACEPFTELFVVAVNGEYFDGERPSQLRIASEVDGAHASLAKKLDDFVSADLRRNLHRLTSPMSGSSPRATRVRYFGETIRPPVSKRRKFVSLASH